MHNQLYLAALTLSHIACSQVVAVVLDGSKFSSDVTAVIAPTGENDQKFLPPGRSDTAINGPSYRSDGIQRGDNPRE